MLAAAVPGAWQLRIAQGTAGYRFSLDAFLLADFVSPCTPQPVLDLGTGCGVIALLLSRRFPQAFIVGLELQKTLIADAGRNVAENRLTQRVALLQGDARQSHNLFPPGAFSTVVCNPPYRAVSHGRLNPNPSRAIARHELTLTLAQWVAACRHLLAKGGLLTLIYHPSRLVELCAQLRTARLQPRRLRLVHSTLQTPASMVLLEAVKDGGDTLTVLPPLVIYEVPGSYTPEMQAIFAGRCLGGNLGAGGM